MKIIVDFCKNLISTKIKSISVNNPNQLFSKTTIFLPETFNFPDTSDIHGIVHPFFKSYTYSIPEQYVLCIPNGKCIIGSEEVFTATNTVIEEITSQKQNPLTGTKVFFHPVKKIKGTVANLSLSGLEKNYYHFSTEFLLRYYVFLQSHIKTDYYIIDISLPFQKEIIKLLKIPFDKILSLPSKTIIQADVLVTTSLVNNWEFVFFNGHKHWQKQWLPSWNNKIYNYLIEQIDTSFNSSEKIYISRNHGSKRIIENEELLIGILQKYGFTTFYLEDLSVSEQISLFHNAKYIVAPHGAGLVNLNYCKPNTFLLELFPQVYHDASYKLISYVNKLNYHYLICATSNLNDEPTNDNLTVDLRVISHFLEQKLQQGF